MNECDFVRIALVFMTIVVIALAINFPRDCQARDIWTYDEHGIYSGSIDEYGNQYDQKGVYKGIIDPVGNIYNRNGEWKGYIDYDKYGPKPVYIIPNE